MYKGISFRLAASWCTFLELVVVGQKWTLIDIDSILEPFIQSGCDDAQASWSQPYRTILLLLMGHFVRILIRNFESKFFFKISILLRDPAKTIVPRYIHCTVHTIVGTYGTYVLWVQSTNPRPPFFEFDNRTRKTKRTGLSIKATTVHNLKLRSSNLKLQRPSHNLVHTTKGTIDQLTAVLYGAVPIPCNTPTLIKLLLLPWASVINTPTIPPIIWK